MTIVELPPVGTRDTPYSHVVEPLSLGHVTLRNRIVLPSHTLLYGEDRILSERHVAYYRERALGGVGMVIAEGASVHATARGAFKNSVSGIDKRAIPMYEKLARTLHDLDTVVLVQLFHIGVHMRGFYDFDGWTPLWGPSRVASPRDREIPLEMGQREIDELVAGHADAAANLKLAGIDGVELHAAHSYLLGQFLSPAYNRRTDAYGGTPRKRARIIVEAARAIRERVGPDFVIGVRLSFDEWLGEHGITPEASEEIVDELVSNGIQLVNVSSGGYHSMQYAVAPIDAPEAYMQPFAQRATAAAAGRAKVMFVGRITDLGKADSILATGDTDLVGMTRALLSDPFLVRKSLAGAEQSVVRCVGANFCTTSQPRISCMMNPATGRELRWGFDGTDTRPTAVAKRVLVVGGGPGGMKAAAVAAARGHDVTLWEAADRLGGHVNLISALPTRERWHTMVGNLEQAMADGRVVVRLGTRATVEDVLGFGADEVVVATGSTWQRTGESPLRPERPGIPGAEQHHVLDIRTALERAQADPRSLGARVLVYDETGEYLPIGLADLLSTAGVAVHVVTANTTVGEALYGSADAPTTFPRLAGRGVRMTSETSLEVIGADTVGLRWQWATAPTDEPADTVVLAMGRTAVDDLYAALAGRPDGPVVHRIGDALAPRTTASAIYEGEELGRAL